MPVPVPVTARPDPDPSVPPPRASLRRHPIALRGPVGQWAAPVAGTVTAASPDEFFGDGLRVELGDLTVAQVRLAPSRYEEAPGMPDQVDVCFLLSGALRFTSPGGRREVGPGTLVFSRPTLGDVMEVRTASTLLRATLPAAALRADLLPSRDLPLIQVPSMLVKPFTGVVVGIIGGPQRCRPSTASALRDAVVGMAEALLDEARGERQDVPAAPLAERARLYIDTAFADPGTTPDRVAATLGVSVRSLHLAFEREAMSVARYVQHRRLVEVERALAAGSAESVTALARRFGFSSPDRLARAYRAQFGRPLHERRRTSSRPALTAGTGGCSPGTPRA